MTTHNQIRLEGLDLARCIALVGMVLVNFRLAMGVEQTQASWIGAFYEAIQGRSAATFVVLAGMGFSIGMRKLDFRDAFHLSVRRGFFLIIVGIMNYMIFPADIIHYYGVYFLVAALLLTQSSRKLLAWMLGIVFSFPVLCFLIDYSLGWNWQTLEYTDFWTLSGFFRNLFFNGWHPVLPWVAFLLWGMWLAQTDLQKTRVQIGMVVGGLICAVATHAASKIGIALWPSYQGMLGVSPLPPMPLYIFASAGIATTLIGVCILLMQKWGRVVVLRALLPAGRMTLTLYIAHIILGMGTLEAVGWLQGQSLAQVTYAALTYSLIAILFAWCWTRYFQHGPLEWLMRWSTQLRSKPQ